MINHLITEAKKLKITKISIETGSGTFFAPARSWSMSSEFNLKLDDPEFESLEDRNESRDERLVFNSSITWLERLALPDTGSDGTPADESLER